MGQSKAQQQAGHTGSRSVQIAVYLFLVSYFIVGAASHYQETFPFFSWRLFDKVPPRVRSEYDILIYTSVGDNAVLFRDAAGVARRTNSVDAYFTIQAMGKAYARRDWQTVQTLRAFFEERYLHPPLAYALVRTRYSPIERWETGRYSTQILHGYTVGVL